MSNVGIDTTPALVCPNTELLHYCKAALWIWRTVPPLLIIFGTLGNTLNFIVLFRKRLRYKPFTIILRILAVSDTAYLWSSAVKNMVFNLQGFHLHSVSSIHCYLEMWLNYTSGYISIWSLMLLTFQRLLVTISPIWAKEQITFKSTWISSVIGCVVIMLTNSHFLFGFSLQYVERVDLNISTYFNRSGSSFNYTYSVLECVPRSDAYARFLKSVYWIFLTLSYAIFAVLVIAAVNLTTTILLLVHRCRMNQQSTAKYISRATKSLLLVSFYFCVALTPVNALIVYRFFVVKNVTDEVVPKLVLFNAIAMNCLYSNYACNFVLYFYTGEQFKEELHAMIAEIRNKTFGSKVVSSSSQSQDTSETMKSEHSENDF